MIHPSKNVSVTQVSHEKACSASWSWQVVRNGPKKLEHETVVESLLSAAVAPSWNIQKKKRTASSIQRRETGVEEGVWWKMKWRGRRSIKMRRLETRIAGADVV
jgi:hypothetical protein